MRPVVVLSAAALNGLSIPVVLDYHLTPANIGLAITMNGAVATCVVQLSLDDPFATYATDYNTNATWFDHPVLTGITSDSVDNLSIPARAVRLKNTAWTSGNPKLTVVQAGGIA